MASHVSKYLHVGHMASHVSPCMKVGRSMKRGGDSLVEEGRSIKEMRRKKKKERKERKKEREREGEERERERERKGSPAFRRSELVGPRSKVCIFDEGYAARGRDSSYFGLFPPQGAFCKIWECCLF